MVAGLAAGAFAAPGDATTVARQIPGLAPPLALDARYPYGAAAFSIFVDDSYREAGAAALAPFSRWFAEAYAKSRAKLAGAENLSLQQALTERAQELRTIRDPQRKARLEIASGAWLHRLIKEVIPRFSLERGFEFALTVKYGERQCLLQSTLIAGLLQAMDINAGVYMVWKNPAGQESNNGHAVTVIRLADGRDILVDASEADPFARHQGLFVMERTAPRYRFMLASYDTDAPITAYRPAAGGRALTPREVRPLDVTFLRSQFYYYRGEQAPGGFLGRPSTAAGLAASARYLRMADLIDPQNPLAEYVLGHVYTKQGRAVPAKTQYITGYRLYAAFGHVPQGPRAAYAQVTR